MQRSVLAFHRRDRARAQRIAAHQDAEKKGKGVVLVDGKLIENLHVANAKRLVAMAEAIEAALRA